MGLLQIPSPPAANSAVVARRPDALPLHPQLIPRPTPADPTLKAPISPTPAETSVPGPAALPTPPEGTTLLTIGRIRPGSQRRGGKREHVARVAPGDLRAALLAQAPGRYRVACINRHGHFVSGGSFAVEVSAGAQEPVKVQARTPGDYPRRPASVEHALKRGTQRIEERVQVLQADLREARTARARAERAVATQREQHSKESLHLHAAVEALVEQVGRLVDRVKELEARQDARHRKGRANMAEVREELANERRQREAAVARLAASVSPMREASPAADRQAPRSDANVVAPRPAPIADTPTPIEGSPTTPASAPPPSAEAALAPGFAALADVRAVPRRTPVTSETSAMPAKARPSSLGEALDRYLRLHPPRPK